MSVPIRFDPASLGAVLKGSQMQDAVRHVAEAIAANVDAQGLVAQSGVGNVGPEIKGTVRVSVSDRARATVTIAHPAGIAMQAKHGVLTRAANAAGFEVTD